MVGLMVRLRASLQAYGVRLGGKAYLKVLLDLDAGRALAHGAHVRVGRPRKFERLREYND